MVDLREKVATLERRGAYSVSPPTASATLGSYSHFVSSGAGSGLTAQASPQLERGLGGLGVPRGLRAHLTYLEAADANAGHAPGTGETMDTEGAPQAPRGIHG